MSCALTKRQVLAGTKDVTRRLGWEDAEPGDVIVLVEKCMGLKKGEKHTILRTVKLVSVRREPLNKITADDCRREGFPELTPRQFVTMFCQHMKCERRRVVTRLEWQYLDDPQQRLF